MAKEEETQARKVNQASPSPFLEVLEEAWSGTLHLPLVPSLAFSTTRG